MTDIGLVTDLYRSELSRFEREVAGPAPAWKQQLRQAAGARFAALGFPASYHEEWRHTDVTPIMEIPFTFATRGRDITKAELEPLVSWVRSSYQLIFVNGHFSSALSSLNLLAQGMTAGSLVDSCTASSALLEPHLGRYADYGGHPFVALNTAFLNDGAFIYLPPKMTIEDPILVVFVSYSHSEPTVSHPRTFIMAGPSSNATIIEIYVGLTESLYLTNAVTEVVLGKDAVLNHHLLRQESRASYHIATLAVHQGCHSTFTSHSLAVGSALDRSEVRALLDDEGSTCILRGIYVATDRQHADVRTRIEHAKPQCTSQQLYKGILSGHATGVFHGKILVRQDAHKIDARQTNNNLLLSEHAMIHTTPQLEIFADDVKCAHGATVGQLDRDALFYLRSRGIDLELARRLMTHAFSSEAIRPIAHDQIRDRFTELLSQWTHETHSDSLSA